MTIQDGAPMTRTEVERRIQTYSARLQRMSEKFGRYLPFHTVSIFDTVGSWPELPEDRAAVIRAALARYDAAQEAKRIVRETPIPGTPGSIARRGCRKHGIDAPWRWVPWGRHPDGTRRLERSCLLCDPVNVTPNVDREDRDEDEMEDFIMAEIAP